MIRRLRRRHLLWTATLGVLVVLGIVLALGARPDWPVVDRLPATTVTD